MPIKAVGSLLARTRRHCSTNRRAYALSDAGFAESVDETYAVAAYL